MGGFDPYINKLRSVIDWLVANDARRFFINRYANGRGPGRGELVVVLSDPDAAMLLRLSV